MCYCKRGVLSTLQCNAPKPSLKISTASAIFWIYLGIFKDYNLKNISFSKKTFLFFKIESSNFQHLFEIEFHETSQNFNSFSSFNQLLFSFVLLVVWLSSNFVSFHKCFFKQMMKISPFYLEKKPFRPLSISKQKNFKNWPNFQWRFCNDLIEPSLPSDPEKIFL